MSASENQRRVLVSWLQEVVDQLELVLVHVPGEDFGEAFAVEPARNEYLVRVGVLRYTHVAFALVHLTYSLPPVRLTVIHVNKVKVPMAIKASERVKVVVHGNYCQA
jgi:energy-converting hydrogenase Eha subunit E